MRIKKELSFAVLVAEITPVGKDWLIILSGGEKPHIGCVVMAIPRLSLTGNGQMSATSSVMNVTGHKDEELCRFLAEQVAKKKEAVTVCTGGFHMDHMSKEQIDEVIQAVRNIAADL